MSVDEIILWLMAIFAVLGAVDRIFGSRFGLGKQFEEGILAGGIGETFDYELTKIGYNGIYKITAIEDRFVPHSTVAAALKYNCLDADSMYSIMKND